jgi:hypothetical protein
MNGEMDTWRHVDMETWIHGDMDTWRHGGMETWEPFPSSIYRLLVMKRDVFLLSGF